ncbi:TPA: type II 3-dehydroquinate dehydratase [Candidatus Scatousia excrementigallinarum]|uniref:3-dehydroquinate dehydratase n=1 Tax=Candidatus Scatousia excrementigallinarum TaxID=2840935 RepID=A0A9D1JNQ3_9BACT|nr:type II 3-dehydroquinate dehydratase [Candidatus Scatousia excrementigallinarum]
MKIFVINGVNMNMLGIREPEKYGSMTLKDLEKLLYAFSFELGADIEMYQSNHEGEIVEKIHSAYNNADGIIINPGAYTHTSVAIRDALAAVNIPTVEIHMTNIHGREDFRHKSIIAPVCMAQISGFGFDSYKLGLKGLVDFLKINSSTKG